MSFRTEPVMSCGKVRQIMSELSFAALRCRFQTGRSYVISGEGRNRVYGYRTGVQCDLGDIERTEWADMIRELIQQKGEQKLQQQLLQHLKDHNYAKETKAELEFKALELHADRIFDNELWVDFLVFNQKNRPEVIASTRLILIMPECCKNPGYLTQTSYEENESYNYCPHCGRWTEISLAEEVQYA